MLQNAKLEEELAELHRQYLPADEARKNLAEMADGARRVISGTFASIAPTLVGVTEAECGRRLRDAVDAVLIQFHNGPARAA